MAETQVRDGAVEAGGVPATTVTVRCSGHVRDAVGEPRLEFTFEGMTLRAFLAAFFEEHPVADLVMASTDEEEATDGWAPDVDTPPGTWRANPSGERPRRYARVTINGRFNEHIGGLDAELEDGDRIGLLYPFIFCC